MIANKYLKYLMDEDEEEQECPSILHKRLASFALLAAVVVGAEEYTPQYRVIGKRPNEYRNREVALNQIKKIGAEKPQFFKRMYRLGVPEFNELVGLISPILMKNSKHSKNPIPAEYSENKLVLIEWSMVEAIIKGPIKC